jgi:hypothetical protein
MFFAPGSTGRRLARGALREHIDYCGAQEMSKITLPRIQGFTE